eukprot:scaffold2636_cov340-Pavlova_lutheri.AAC.78
MAPFGTCKRGVGGPRATCNVSSRHGWHRAFSALGPRSWLPAVPSSIPFSGLCLRYAPCKDRVEAVPIPPSYIPPHTQSPVEAVGVLGFARAVPPPGDEAPSGFLQIRYGSPPQGGPRVHSIREGATLIHNFPLWIVWGGDSSTMDAYRDTCFPPRIHPDRWDPMGTSGERSKAIFLRSHPDGKGTSFLSKGRERLGSKGTMPGCAVGSPEVEDLPSSAVQAISNRIRRHRTPSPNEDLDVPRRVFSRVPAPAPHRRV